MGSVRQRIENAIIVRLQKCLGKPNGGYLEAIEPYNGEIDQQDGPEDFICTLKGRSPAVLVATGSATYDPESVGRNRWQRLITVEIFVSSKHMRTKENRNRSDVVADGDKTADPGIYQIIDDVFEQIAGDCFGLSGVGRLAPTREDVLLQEDCFTVWRLTYESAVDAIGAKRDASDQLITEFQIDSNLVDDDQVTVLPAPPNPFAEADTTI